VIGEKVCVLAGDCIVEELYSATAALEVKLITNSINAQADPTTAPVDNITLENRVYRPACPANIKFNGGSPFVGPTDPVPPVTITWANRNRTSANVYTIVDNTNEYETGQQTVIRYQVNGGAWVPLTFGPGVTTSGAITTGAIAGQIVNWEIYSSRDGVNSYNKWSFNSLGGGSSSSSGSGGSSSTGDPPPADGSTGSYTSPPEPISLVFPFGAGDRHLTRSTCRSLSRSTVPAG
jgi:hypothetical protein